MTPGSDPAAGVSLAAPGSALLDAVAVMDRLRSPGGCPWDAEQTHESLVPYLLDAVRALLGPLQHVDQWGARPSGVADAADEE